MQTSGKSRRENAESRSRLERRHCERSEAIQSSLTRRDGLLRFARNDVERDRRVGKA